MKLEFLSERDEIIHQMLSGKTEKEAEEFKAFLAAGWEGPGTYQLADSNALLSVPEDYKVLLGYKAKRQRNVFCEAIVYDNAFEHSIIFEDFKTGHISLDSWDKIDPASLLESAKEDEKTIIAQRRQKGEQEIYTIDWLQKPLLDRHTNTIYWATEKKGSEVGFARSVALRLYRHGCACITCTTHISAFEPFNGPLEHLLQAHSFDSGLQYQDYDQDDAVAKGGIAQVMAMLFGGEITLTGEVAEKPGIHKLNQSHSTLSLPEGFKLIKGSAAKEVNGIYCEAAAFDAFDNMITFEDFKVGYLFLDNWNKIEPISLMERVKEVEKKRIEEQVKNGEVESSRTLGWLKTPWLDKATNTVYWAIEITDGKRNCLNSVALKLYREGCVKMTWSTENVSSFVPSGGPLDIMVKSHSFDPGFQYEDSESDDLATSDGIAEVVAMFLGVDIDMDTDEDLEDPQ